VKIEFHSGLSEPLGHACRLLRKAHATGARVLVHGPPATLDQLDQLLWTFDALSFVPHARLRGSARPTPTLQRTPTWLVDDVAALPDRDVLVNMGHELVPGWEGFARVIELVPADAAASAAARRRWRVYAELPGVELIHHAAVP
jgi:DNA polymerase-3 subunit chi